MSQLSDDELTDRWESQRLGGSGVSHIDHVRWLGFSIVGTVSRRRRSGSWGARKGCDHYGVPERFDERLTRRWATVISSAATDRPASENFEEFIARNPELRRGDRLGKPHECT